MGITSLWQLDAIEVAAGGLATVGVEEGLTAECTTWGIAVMVFAFASCSIRAMSPGDTFGRQESCSTGSA
jgi:hypothetical protein